MCLRRVVVDRLMLVGFNLFKLEAVGAEAWVSSNTRLVSCGLQARTKVGTDV